MSRPILLKSAATKKIINGSQIGADRAANEFAIWRAQQQKDFLSAISEQRRANEALTATLKAQALQIQKVSDQLRTQSPPSRVVTND
jgi:hypothetical protein